jgi:integrase/recombinase XerD
LNISPPLKAFLLKHGAAAYSSTFHLAKELSMTSLRQRMIEDMQIRNLAANTQESYVQQVSLFARHFNKSPEVLGPEQIRTYQVYLTNEKKLATGSILISISALRFLYKVTLKKSWSLEEVIPAPKKPQTLPIVLSPEEVIQFLDCVRIRKHRVILTTCYAAGLRISEAVALTPPVIDSKRMVLRVEQGKGKKDRYVMLSPKLLEILREWWRVEKPEHWLFRGDKPGWHITSGAVEHECQKAHRICKISKPITPHSLRHAFAVHLLEQGTDVRSIQLLLGHRSLATTAKYLRIATSKVCSATSPLDLLPRPVSMEVQPTPPQYF